MSKLVIKVSGTVEQSNFDEWKDDLLSKLDAVSTELSSDSEFAEAADAVKVFKAAEKTLKQARESALKQSADISKLFAAIDEVAERTREVRLTLERQVKKRKEEIKDEAVDEAYRHLQKIIKSQSESFQLIRHDAWLDRDILEEAVKGTRSTSGMQKALKQALAGLADQIEARAETVKANAAILDGLDAGKQVVLQDRAYLLGLETDALNKLIDERVATLQAAAGAEPADAADAEIVEIVEEPLAAEADDLFPPEGELSEADVSGEEQAPDSAEDDSELEVYEVVVTLKCTVSHAADVMTAVREMLEGDETVQDVGLRQD